MNGTVHKNKYTFEYQYVQESVKAIRGKIKDNKKIKLNINDDFRHIVNLLMKQDDEYAQMSYKKGLKRHGSHALDAMIKEYAQMGEDKKECSYLCSHLNLHASKRERR